MRELVWLVPLLIACGPAARPQETDPALRGAARSPYAIKRFVDTHDQFKWDDLWAALHVGDDVFAQPCDHPSDCSAELIVVPGSANRQVILRLNWAGNFWAVFLRFYASPGPPGAQTAWRCAGSFEPDVKYFRPEHHLISLGGKPFLLVSEQAWSGSGLSVKMISGFDLSRHRFEADFKYVAEGHVEFPCHVNREVWGYPYSFEQGSTETLRIRYRVRYYTDTCEDPDTRIELGSASTDAVYTRTGYGDFKIDPSSANGKEIEAVYWSWDPSLSDEDFLRYNFDNLDRIATGPRDRSRRWLGRFLAGCADTPEKKRLAQALLLQR